MGLDADDKLLISKFLDDNLSESELIEFEQKILNDQVFADAFAELSRIDYGIEHNLIENAAVTDTQEMISIKKDEFRDYSGSTTKFHFGRIAALITISVLIVIFLSVASKDDSKPVSIVEDESVKKKNKEQIDESYTDGMPGGMPGNRLLSSGIKNNINELVVPKVVRFNKHVQPILSDKCYFCHGPDDHERKGDLRLDVRELAIKAEAIVPGDPNKSLLIERITLDHNDEDIMPPLNSHKELTATEIAILKKWIKSGAKYETHWAYTEVKHNKKASIDSLVSKRLKDENLKFSKQTDARTLTRRLYLDLTGLPPKPEDLPKADYHYKPEEIEALVDKLLSSPAYGERMASWWLDAVRYANTIGYHSDIPIPTSPYRDWVIKAFNNNMPYDQFTIEQIAGDLLANPTTDQRIASAYNRIGQQSHEGGIQDREYVKKYQSERVRTTSTAWLGSTLMCAECHNHKFDPYTQKDFYTFAAFFADILESGSNNKHGSFNDDIKKYQSDTMIFETLPMSMKRNRERNVTTGAIMLMPTKEQLAKLKASKSDYKKYGNALAGVDAVVTTLSGKPREVKILNRGDWMDDSGEIVYPATPAFLPNHIKSTKDKRLNRLDLAKWISDKENPLTARVFANRLWTMFFKTGLSRVVNDLGLQGEWPEHQELLDWLAAEFMEKNWDIKRRRRLRQDAEVQSTELKRLKACLPYGLK